MFAVCGNSQSDCLIIVNISCPRRSTITPVIFNFFQILPKVAAVTEELAAELKSKRRTKRDVQQSEIKIVCIKHNIEFTQIQILDPLPPGKSEILFPLRGIAL